MTEIEFAIFVVASLLIIITPGQDLVLVFSRGISQGPRTGIVTAAGVSAGLLGHTIFAVIGLGALLVASELIFTIIKLVSASYLIYLGFKLIYSKVDVTESSDASLQSLKTCFSVGALSNLSNPKVTIFYFAYLPQFISTEQNSPKILFVLGVTFALLTFIVKGTVGYFAGRFSDWIRSNQKMLSWLSRTSGSLLVIFGIKLALERN